MITSTYGVMPSREAFELAFERELPSGSIEFQNDKRLGSDSFSCGQLWAELEKAHGEYEMGDSEFTIESCLYSDEDGAYIASIAPFPGCNAGIKADGETIGEAMTEARKAASLAWNVYRDTAGNWCDAILYSLGFEWV